MRDEPSEKSEKWKRGRAQANRVMKGGQSARSITAAVYPHAADLVCQVARAVVEVAVAVGKLVL